MNYIQYIKNLLSKEMDIETELLDFYVLVFLLRGKNTSLENIHDAWAVWKNITFPEHRSIIPFNRLSKDVQELDRKYADIIVSFSHKFSKK